MPPKPMTKEVFIEKARQVHGEKYDYSKVVYKNSRTPVIVICPKHGPFKVRPANHLHGTGCKKCAIEKRKYDTEKFIEKARKVHGEKYDYSKVKYIDAHTKVTIICPEHGEFEQTPGTHLYGVGCPLCGQKKAAEKHTLTREEFIRKAREVHGNKYDYSKVRYKNADEKVIIICPKHGEFKQRAIDHLRGHGCRKCAVDESSKAQLMTREEFIARAKNIHVDEDGKPLYNYSKVDYRGRNMKVTIICPRHGPWQVTPNNHIHRESGCPKCMSNVSKFELEVLDFVSKVYDGNIETSNRSLISPYELDIYMQELGLAIECNGTYWHSYGFDDYISGDIDKSKHLLKTELCESKNIHLIQIFEHEWKTKKKILKSMLRAKLGIIGKRIYARNCDIAELSPKKYRSFLQKNHIQGYQPARLKLGLVYDNDLVAVLGITKSRFGSSLELVRYAVQLNTCVVGGFSKLLKAALKQIPKNSKIVAYADRRFTYRHENVYTKSGFSFSHTTKPNYYYCRCGITPIVYSRIAFQKHRLSAVLEDFEPDKPEMWNVLKNGYRVFFDCGNLVYTIYT